MRGGGEDRKRNGERDKIILLVLASLANNSILSFNGNFSYRMKIISIYDISFFHGRDTLYETEVKEGRSLKWILLVWSIGPPSTVIIISVPLLPLAFINIKIYMAILAVYLGISILLIPVYILLFYAKSKLHEKKYILRKGRIQIINDSWAVQGTTIVFIDEIDGVKYVKLKPFQDTFTSEGRKYFYNKNGIFSPKYQNKIYYIKMKGKLRIFSRARHFLAPAKHISLNSIDERKKVLFQSLLKQYRFSKFGSKHVIIPKHIIDKYQELGYHFPLE